MANIASSYIFTLPHTVIQERVEVLLVRRQLIQTLVNGRPHRGVIPNWAGQWGLIAARPLVSQSMEQTVQGAVLAQTGIDLSAPVSAERYRIVGSQPHTLMGRGNKPVAVLFLTFLPEGLRAFAADAAEHIGDGKVHDGVIDTLEIEPVSRALTLIGPREQPPEGWVEFISGARPRGGGLRFLGSGASMLAGQLVERSAMAPKAARLVVDTLVACMRPEEPTIPPAPGQGGRLSELQILGARLHESGLWYQTYAPGQALSVRAVTTSQTAQALAIEWQGGEPDPEGRPDWRSLPLDRLSEPEAPFSIRASLDGISLEASIAVVPELIGVEVVHPQSIERENGGFGTIASDEVWIRARLCPATESAYRHLNWYGGSVDPNHPHDRRLVSFRELTAFTVEANRGLCYRLGQICYSCNPRGELHIIESRASL
ncbi:MAG: hypothetical protein PVF13_05960 [Chromatiales bacterium]